MAQWRTADGRIIDVSDMTAEHLRYALAFMRERCVVLEDEMNRRGMDVPEFRKDRLPRRKRRRSESAKRFRNIEFMDGP